MILLKSVFIIAIVAVAMIGVMVPSVFAQSNDLILILDPFPMTSNEGDSIMFSGVLLTADGQYVISDAPILIKSDVPYGVDQSIAFATTDENGEFFTNWVATSDRINYNLYAIFEGDSVIPEVQSERFTFTVISNDNSSCDQKNFNSRINIDSVPSSAYVGETIEFVGTLSDVNGCPLINQKIHLVNPHIVRPYPDEIISSKDIVFATTTTNSQGMFVIEWNATHVVNDLIPELDLVFEGGNGSGSTKKSIDLEILRYNSYITLDPIPASANIGDVITFSGTVELENENPDRYVVFIKDEDPLNQDDLLVSAEVNPNGQFSTAWIVMNLDTDGIADIYATFEGTPTHHRSTTCDDSGTTGDFGATCLNTIPLKINTSDTPPEWITPTDNSPKPYSFNGDEYAKMVISYDMPRTPVVVIIPHPDNYDAAVKYATAVKEGILTWSFMIENEYGGDWDVDFVVLDKEYPQFPKEYDIKMHLVTFAQDTGCFDKYGGWAQWSSAGYDLRPINSHVCLTQLAFGNTAQTVSLISAHEFIHGMGMGHVWNKSNDLMCSSELVNGEKVKTCPNSGFNQESIPSDFDLATVTYMYGTDGWKNPNPNITPQNIFTADNFLNKENSLTPVAPTPVAPTPVAPTPVAPTPEQISDEVNTIEQLEAEQKAQEVKIEQLEAEQKEQQKEEQKAQEVKIAQLESEQKAQEVKIAQLESEQNGGGCLIATATYGSEMATEVQQLRELRDNQLLQTESGTAFMAMFNDIYYSFSPIIADYERENPLFKEAVKLAITPMISTLSLMENANSESEVLGLGLSVIALNLGMYLGVPAVVIVGIRKRI